MQEKTYFEDEITKEELISLIKRLFPLIYNSSEKEYAIIFLGFNKMIPKDVNTLHSLWDKEKGR